MPQSDLPAQRNGLDLGCDVNSKGDALEIGIDGTMEQSSEQPKLRKLNPITPVHFEDCLAGRKA